ncbi:MAG TPA: hypothetical protein VF668_14290 [Pyrinomonadaceae bacterium]|jgi:hypothetical protein
MFCPNCGKGEQEPGSYCRSCGEFLTDLSAKSYLLNKLLGGGGPRTQVRAGLVINAVTFLVSLFLLGFLNGHFDAQRERTGEGPPWVIYMVYVFLGLVATWQFLGIAVNLKLLKKLGGGKKVDARDALGERDAAGREGRDLPPGRARGSLQGGGLEDAAGGAEQRTTKILDKLPRR